MDSPSASDVEVTNRFGIAIGRLNRRIRSSPGGLTHGLLSALATIVEWDGIRPRDLGRVEVLAPSAVTRLLDMLTARGLVERVPDPEDRRSFRAVATADGLAYMRTVQSERAVRIGAILTAVSPTQATALLDALPALEAAVQAAGFGPESAMSAAEGSRGARSSP